MPFYCAEVSPAHALSPLLSFLLHSHHPPHAHACCLLMPIAAPSYPYPTAAFLCPHTVALMPATGQGVTSFSGPQYRVLVWWPRAKDSPTAPGTPAQPPTPGGVGRSRLSAPHNPGQPSSTPQSQDGAGLGYAVGTEIIRHPVRVVSMQWSTPLLQSGSRSSPIAPASLPLAPGPSIPPAASPGKPKVPVGRTAVPAAAAPPPPLPPSPPVQLALLTVGADWVVRVFVEVQLRDLLPAHMTGGLGSQQGDALMRAATAQTLSMSQFCLALVVEPPSPALVMPQSLGPFAYDQSGGSQLQHQHQQGTLHQPDSAGSLPHGANSQTARQAAMAPPHGFAGLTGLADAFHMHGPQTAGSGPPLSPAFQPRPSAVAGGVSRLGGGGAGRGEAGGGRFGVVVGLRAAWARHVTPINLLNGGMGEGSASLQALQVGSYLLRLKWLPVSASVSVSVSETSLCWALTQIILPGANNSGR